MKGIRRPIGTAKQGKAPVMAELLMRMVTLCPDSMIGRRDRAQLALGFAGALRRSELCALDVADLTGVPDGFRVTIRHSKTDQEGKGEEIAIPRGFRLRPAEAVQTWLQASGIVAGPVFRGVWGGRVSEMALTADQVSRIVKRHAKRVGLDPATYSAHSLRAGYVSTAVELNAPLLKIAEQTRHRSLDMLRVYNRRADLFRDHSGAGFL